VTGRGKRSQQKGPPVNPELAALRAAVTEGLPPGNERTGEVGVSVRAGGRGNKGRWVGERFVSHDEIIENIRALLADNWTAGDIKRAMVRKFGGTSKSFLRHLSYARKRNLQNIERKPEEAKSDSVQQWSRLLAEERQKRAQYTAEVAAAKAKLTLLQAGYDAAEGGEDLEIARDRLDVGLGMLDRAEKLLASAKYWIVNYQHTIDRILGNLAPMEFKDTSEKKAELANPTEPLTAKESDAKLRELLGKIRGEITAEVSTPSTN